MAEVERIREDSLRQELAPTGGASSRPRPRAALQLAGRILEVFSHGLQTHRTG
jgi:hypothetical protein